MPSPAWAARAEGAEGAFRGSPASARVLLEDARALCCHPAAPGPWVSVALNFPVEQEINLRARESAKERSRDKMCAERDVGSWFEGLLATPLNAGLVNRAGRQERAAPW